jgi:hypothetical protein
MNVPYGTATGCHAALRFRPYSFAPFSLENFAFLSNKNIS